MKNVVLPILIVGLAACSLTAQDANKSRQVSRLNLNFQLVRTDGTNIYIEQDYQDRTAEMVELAYTVTRQVTETVEVDGKTVTRTKLVPETRTRKTYPIKRRSVPIAENYKFTNLSGKEIPKIELIGKLGMGSGRFVLSTFAGQKIPPGVSDLLDKNTIVMTIRGPVTPNARPAGAAGRAEFRLRATPAIKIVPNKK